MSLLKPDETSPLERRSFIKLVVAGSAGVAAAACRTQTRTIAPLLIPEEHITPGVAYWSRGVCRQCDAGCGVLVKRMEAIVPLTVDGKPFRQSRLVAKKLEGNPDHPLNQGGLCARGQAALEATYHPMRLAGPMRRAGSRGGGTFEPVQWTAALATLKREVAAAPAGAVGWLGRPLRGTEADLVDGWIEKVGGHRWEYRALPAPRAAADAARLERLGDADFVLSFGNFLEGWPGQAPTTRAYSRFRRGRRGVFFQVEPRMSLTASNADRWIGVRPGTEGIFALGVAAELRARHPARFATADTPPAPEGLDAYAAPAVEEACGVQAGAVQEAASALAAATHPLVVGGPSAYAYPNGAFHERAIGFLAALTDGTSRPASVADDATGATAFAAPLPAPPRVLILHDVNPVFSAPPGWKLDAWLRAIPTIVVLATLPDESVLGADLVLPLSTTLESWADDERRTHGGSLVATLNAPAMKPLHDTRSLLEIVVGLDESAGGASENPGRDAIQRHWRALQTEFAPSQAFTAFWAEAVGRGGFWTAPAASAPRPPQHAHPVAPSPVPPPTAAAPTSDYPLHLRLYESPLFGDGAGSWLTWLQELPDPTSSAMWCSWVEVHPRLAAKLGLQQGDGVWVESSAGKIELPVFFYPGLRPDTIAIPTGQGHHAGDAVTNRGANPFALLVDARDADTGALAWEATRVRLTPSGRRPPLPLFGRSLQHPVTHR